MRVTRDAMSRWREFLRERNREMPRERRQAGAKKIAGEHLIKRRLYVSHHIDVPSCYHGSHGLTNKYKLHGKIHSRVQNP
jgi:hypothetical protein